MRATPCSRTSTCVTRPRRWCARPRQLTLTLTPTPTPTLTLRNPDPNPNPNPNQVRAAEAAGNERGRRYLVGNQRMRTADFYALVAQLSGQPRPARETPIYAWTHHAMHHAMHHALQCTTRQSPGARDPSVAGARLWPSLLGRRLTRHRRAAHRTCRPRAHRHVRHAALRLPPE